MAKAAKVLAKSNLRAVDASLHADVENVGFAVGSAFRNLVDLLKSAAAKRDDKETWKALSASYRRGFIAAKYMQRDAANVKPEDLRAHGFALADKLIATALAAHTAEQKALYRSAVSNFDHARKVAGVDPIKAPPASKTPKTPDATATTPVPATAPITAARAPHVVNPAEAHAQALELANLLDQACKENGQYFTDGILTAFHDCIATVRKVAKVETAPAS